MTRINEVDILFVIDDSGSMSGVQTNLRAGFNGFLNGISNLNWRIAFTTTSNSQPGARAERTPPLSRRGCERSVWKLCSRGPDGLFAKIQKTNFFGRIGSETEADLYFLDSSLSSNQNTLNTYLQNTIRSIEARGNWPEKGFYALYKAVNRYKTCQDNSSLLACRRNLENKPNKEFFREEAALVVILFSDTDEWIIKSGVHRDSDYPQTPKRLIDYVKQVFGITKKFKVHTVLAATDRYVGNTVKFNGKSCADASAVTGTSQFLRLAQLTQGKVMDITRSPYTSCLQNLGESIEVLTRNSIVLGCLPVDKDGDGTKDEPEIRYSSRLRSSPRQKLDPSTFSPYLTNPTRSGNTLTFPNSLPTGTFELTYYCSPSET